MKNKRLHFAFFFAVMLFASHAYAQMNYWTTPPYKFNMSVSIPTFTALPGPGGAYSVANGAYDENGNLLFYVQDYSIYGPTGLSVGVLPGYNMGVCGEAYTILNPEVNIVPIPGTCRQFYVIYSMDNPVGYSPVLYVKVNCSGTTPVVSYNGTVYASCPPWYAGFFNVPFWVSGHGGSDNTAMAVSKVISGSGSTAKRFLFSVSNSEIVKSEITSAGISSGTPVVNAASLGLSTADFAAFEAEFSWGNNCFAWSSYNGKVHVIRLAADGNFITGSLQSYSIPGAKGIEFTMATDNPKLYVSGRNGLTQILTSNQTQSLVSTGTFDLTNTFLEYAKNNRIYGISPTYNLQGELVSTTLVGINWLNNSLISVNAGFDSRYIESASFTNGVFTLPEQIDGENYSYFNGTPAVAISNFTLNGSVPIGNCDQGGFGNYCQNSPIAFNATYSAGTPTKYKFDIQAVDWGCTFITGAGLMNYHGAWTNGTPVSNLDLRTLSANGINLGNCLGGLVLITYSVQDACGIISTYSKAINMYVPIPPIVALEIYNKDNPQSYLPPSQNINSPVLCGSASIGYRVNNSTGTITSLTVKIEQMSPYKVLYDKTTSVNGVSNLTYESLNGYCISSAIWSPYTGFESCNTGYTGWSGYFSYTNGLFSFNKTLKLTVTVGNQCGSNTNWSYLKVNSIGNKMANADIGTGKDWAEDLLVYPNPASDQITVRFNSLYEEYFQVDVVDMTGRQVLLLLPDTKIEKGIFEKSFDITILRSGIYSYRVKSATSIKTGIISKF